MPKSNVLLKGIALLLVIVGPLVFLHRAYNQQEQRGQTSYMKVDSTESFADGKNPATKAEIESGHLAVLKRALRLERPPGPRRI
jgi:hypothetical protein